MIIARLEKLGTAITGSCKFPHYDAKDGWFPADSFQFSVKGKKDSNGARGSGGGGGQAGGGASARASASATTSSTATAEKEEHTLSLDKEVDAATCYLMWLAMEGRKSKKGIGDKLKADIHVLSSIMIDQRRYVYPSLMIHLDEVVVDEWSVNGSGDDRPKESLTLRYDKVAVNYRATPDGKEFQDYPPGGMAWDQTTGAQFRYDGFQKFLD